MKTIKVGIMPGRIQEFAIGLGTTIGEVLEIAELDSTGYEIKVDGGVGSLEDVITEETGLVLLSKMIKGN